MFHLILRSPLLAAAGFALLRSMERPFPVFFRVAAWAAFAGIATMAAVAIVPEAGPVVWQQTRRSPVTRMERDPCLNWLMRETAPKARDLVYPYYPMYYVLADLRNPIRQSFMTYGYHSRCDIAGVIKELDSGPVALVLWDQVVKHDAMRAWFPGYRAPSSDEQLMGFGASEQGQAKASRKGMAQARRGR